MFIGKKDSQAAGQDIESLLLDQSNRMNQLEHRLARQENLIDELQDTIVHQASELQALNPRRRIRSFLLRDLLWVLKSAITAGPRTAMIRFRDFRYLKKSGQFDPDFYARQLGNTTFDGAALLRNYLTVGYRQGLDPSPTFSVEKYAAIYPDVGQANVDPFTHYLRHGRREYRLAPPSARASGNAIKVARRRRKARQDNQTVLVAYLLGPAEVPQFGGYTFSRLMAYLRSSRMDIQSIFDIDDPEGRLRFVHWFVMEARQEYNLPAGVFPADLLETLAAGSGPTAETAAQLLDAQDAPPAPATRTEDRFGANLVGYAFGEFGMGEHVRMVARALSTTETPFGVLDHHVGLHGAGDRSVTDWVTDTAEFGVNIFHVNADVYPLLYFKHGPDFFRNRYTIGFWAWELSQCPPEFDLALNMVDEVWAISEFVAESFRTRARVPVVHMPLAVTVPALDPAQYGKSRYGLAADRFTFFFVFDAASYMDRKNPAAVVRAFRQAFPLGTEKVQLLLKTMNTELGGTLWQDLLREIGNDPRIVILSKRLSRDEVFGLYVACDVFVSLHRSEGFGRCVAEAMAYGKPVICTNYSGTRDFAREDTACVVNYTLVPVPEGAYPFAEGQVWAEPDIAHATQHMRTLFQDSAYRDRIAAAGQAHVLDNFNEKVVGRLYAERIAEVDRERRQRIPAAPVVTVQSLAPDAIEGGIDAPSAADAPAIADVLTLQGWALSPQGIDHLEVAIDDQPGTTMHYGLLRPDVAQAFPDVADASRTGFFHQIDVTELPRGPHRAQVTVVGRGSARQTWRLDFTTVGSPRYTQWLQNRARLNRPVTIPRKPTRFSVAILATGGDVAATVASLKAQSRTPAQLIVVGDAQPVAGAVSVPAGPDQWRRIAAVAESGYVTTLEAGDVLTPDALASLAQAHAANMSDFVYADEDRWQGSERGAPRFKPAWSPHFLAHSNYIGRPWSASTILMARSAATAHDEHDLLRAMTQGSQAVVHLPDVLCTRAGVTETEAAEAPMPDGPLPKVSVIIPTCLKDSDLVAQCLDGLTKATDYPELDIVVITNNLRDKAAAEAFLKRWPVTRIHFDGAFNWSALNNLGVAHATGDLLLFFNDDVVPLDGGWLRRMVQTLATRQAGIVGARLNYPNGTIQHLGLNLIDYAGGARHLFRFCTGDEPRLRWLTRYPREVAGVTGACLLTTRACYQAVGGFNESLKIVCNDVDFCLKAQRKGHDILIEPRACLTHHEGVSRGGLPENDDVKLFWQRWDQILRQPDRFTNPNLDKMRDDWMVDPRIDRLPAARIV